MSGIIDANVSLFEDTYSRKTTFLRYPADWIIRFHSLYLREHAPSGRVLDHGCGSGNNMKFFRDQGYQVYGTEITKAVLPLVAENLGSADSVAIIPGDAERLPYDDKSFDIVICNQVLCFLTEDLFRKIVSEFQRVLRPGGVLFATTMGPKNYYITHHAKSMQDGIYYVEFPPDNRFHGRKEYIYVVRDEAHLKQMFSPFEPITIGYFDQSLLDLKSNFHWIYAGLIDT
jgi:SAM-dependent methyltransferase